MVYGDLHYRCDAARSALVVIDVQLDFCRPPDGDTELSMRMEAMAARLEQLIAAARVARVPVIFVRTVHGVDSDSKAWRSRRGVLADYEHEVCKPGTQGVEFFRVLPEPGEEVIEKHRYDAFVDTELHALLASLGREALLIAGVMTDVCVETTLRHAVCLDYLATVVSDCCAAATPERHELALAGMARSFGSVAAAAEISGIWDSETCANAGRSIAEDSFPQWSIP